ncbi:F-box/WD repeat-containing protein 8 [Ophiophagus hannah]|uniref:F-box/WD repeat-containing protein 8 n=1 Tax=Ophiophagus hannah TaxID=8665 RepID=V8N3N1_OPHHA|nr:F-box/WD repeat-containing protein 8 [Ophiophagus hannah]
MVYDLRRSQPVSSLHGHQLGVSVVQMDDWKVVSGGEEGLVCAPSSPPAVQLPQPHHGQRIEVSSTPTSSPWTNWWQRASFLSAVPRTTK